MIQPVFRRFLLVLFGCLLMPPLGFAENLETPHFLIIYPPSEVSLAETIATSMETARERLSEELGISHEDRLRIKVVPVLTGGGKARYLPDRRIIEVLTIEAMTSCFGGRRPSLPFVEGVLWHEYIHFLQHQVMKRFVKDRDALWFIEGTATYLGTLRLINAYSPEAVWKEGEAFLSKGRLPTLDDLNHYLRANQYPLSAYFFSADAVEYLINDRGMEPLRQMTRCMGEGKDLRQCLSESLGVDLEGFEREWHRSLAQRYRIYIRQS